MPVSARPAVARKVLLDTGPLVALGDARDEHHAWASAEFDALSTREAQLVTCEAVLAEAHHLIRKRTGSGEPFTALVEALGPGVVQGWRPRVLELLRKYPERMDLADACLVALVEEDPRAVVFTVDRVDFSIYRLRGGRAVPTIMPS